MQSTDSLLAEGAGREVTLRYFAWVREKTGRAEEVVTLPRNVLTVGDLVIWLKSRGPEFDDAFKRVDVVRAALDKRHVKAQEALGAAREIAFFPPVTGG